jgi:hypothetical protein
MSDRPSTLGDRLADGALFLADLALVLGTLALSWAIPVALDLHPAIVLCSMALAVLFLWAANGARTRPVATFGTRREVEYAVAREGTCDECGEHVEAGEKRRFAERTFAFGVPLSTADWGVNVYCRDCREGDVASDLREGDDPTADRGGDREPA